MHVDSASELGQRVCVFNSIRESVEEIMFTPMMLLSTPGLPFVPDGQPDSTCDLNWVLAAPRAVACTYLADLSQLHGHAYSV